MSSPQYLPGSLTPEQLFASPMVDQKGVVTRIWRYFFQTLPTPAKVPAFIVSTHAARASVSANSYPNGSIYWESDRGLYYIARKGAWTYLAGTMQAEQAALSSDLRDTDAGLLCCITDYTHWLRWNGAGWEWAPGELGSGFYLAFDSNPGAGWHAANGAANVPRLNGDGTLSFVTIATRAGEYFRQ